MSLPNPPASILDLPHPDHGGGFLRAADQITSEPEPATPEVVESVELIDEVNEGTE